MKAMLRFDLPEEEDEYMAAMHGGDYKSAIECLDSYLRGQIKHGDLDVQEFEVYEEILLKLHFFLEEHAVHIY